MKIFNPSLAFFSSVLLLSSMFLGVSLGSLFVTTVYAQAPLEENRQIVGVADDEFPASKVLPPTFPPNPLITPTNGITVTTPWPTFDWKDANDPGGVASYTLLITGSGVFTSIWGQSVTATITTTGSIYTPTQLLPNDAYTWTVQAHNAVGNVSGYVTPTTFIVEAALSYIFLPIVLKLDPTSACPTASVNTFEVIPFEGPPADHPDYLHGDLNLSLRGYAPTNAFLGLVDISGNTSADPPQLAGLFEPNRLPAISTVYQVNGWDWACGTDGCPGPPITNPKVTMAGFVTTSGEPIHIPERNSNIFGGGYKVLVLYAEEQRITLNYIREDTVAPGFAVHIENVCVDPNLLALYRAQVNGDGWHVTGHLPALRLNQALGTALDTEIQVVIRDKGTFLDPRSKKDWWQGY